MQSEGPQCKPLLTTPIDIRALVRTIAKRLGETHAGPMWTIHRIVQRLGPDATLTLVAKCLDESWPENLW